MAEQPIASPNDLHAPQWPPPLERLALDQLDP
jgi:hypothetical protein